MLFKLFDTDEEVLAWVLRQVLENHILECRVVEYQVLETLCFRK